MVVRERPMRKENGIMKWARVAITEAVYMGFAESWNVLDMVI